MKQSRFNILITPQESPHQAILYNTFHDHRLIIENTDQSLVRFLEKIDRKESLNTEEEETAREFLELGLILQDDADEKAIFDDWYVSKVQNSEGLLNLIVVTTMACNLRCPYCYELEALDNKRSMTPETADKLVDWIKSQIRAKAINTVKITYFGGEPLMNKKALFQISESINDFCKRYGVAYDGGIITNGVLMTPEVSKELRRTGVTWIKVTIDGEKHVHDTTRITASGKGSFDQIMFNLEHCNDDLKEGERPLDITLGGNFSDKTYDGFTPLLDRLAASSFRKYITRINLKPVQSNSSHLTETKSNNPCDTVCFNETNTSRMIYLREELQKRGLPAIDGLNLGPCDFFRGDSFTIGLDGAIYPCIAFVDNASCATGHIDDVKPKAKHAAKQEEWKNAKPWSEDCYECSFLPVCTGGCRATAHANGFSWNSTVCEKDYFKRMSTALAKELLGIAPPDGPPPSRVDSEERPEEHPSRSSFTV